MFEHERRERREKKRKRQRKRRERRRKRKLSLSLRSCINKAHKYLILFTPDGSILFDRQSSGAVVDFALFANETVKTCSHFTSLSLSLLFFFALYYTSFFFLFSINICELLMNILIDKIVVVIWINW